MTDRDSGTPGYPGESSAVTMRNSVHPARGHSHDSDVSGRSDSKTASGHVAPYGHRHLERDASDGPEVFTNEPFSPLMSSNQYQIRKMASQTLMDVALMMANISQLRTLISLGETHVQYYEIMLALVIFSLTCQVTFAILMFVMWVRESDQHQKQDFYDNLKELEKSKGVPQNTTEMARRSLANRQKDFHHNLVTSRLNYFSMILVFFITVTNMFITGFGIKTLDNS